MKNSTYLTDSEKSIREISAVYFTVISVFIVIANLGTVCVVSMKKRKKPTDYLLRILALVDLVTPFCQFTHGIIYSRTGTWFGHQVSCSMIVFISLFLFRFSMILSTMITVDRFLAIAKPFIYRSTIRLRPIKMTLIVSTVYSIILGVLPSIEVMSTRGTDWWRCLYHWKTSHSKHFTRIHIIANVIDSSICVVIVTICNIGVVIYFIQRIRKNAKTSVSSKSEDSNKTRRKKDLKYAKVMSLATLYFPLYIIPTQVIILLDHFNITSISAETASLYQMHIVAISLLCNPIFYALIRKHYRHAYVFILRHPMVLCGRAQTAGFDFDAENLETTDIDRRMNFRKMAVVSLAAARFRKNVADKKSKAKVERACKPSRIVPVIINDDCVNTDNIIANISHNDDLSECSTSLHPRTCSTSTYFSDQESLPPSPGFQTTNYRSRIVSCGSEITECTCAEFDLNSPHMQTLSFDYDVFCTENPENGNSLPLATTFLPVPKERYLKRNRTESDTSSVISTFSECEYESSNAQDGTSADMSEIEPHITEHMNLDDPTSLPNIET